MKCFNHEAQAVAVCPYCGRAMCAACASALSTNGSRWMCSEKCAAALAHQEQTLELLLRKSRESARANSVYYYICSALSAGAAIASWFWLPAPLLMWFLGGSAFALLVSGIWFGFAARKDKL